MPNHPDRPPTRVMNAGRYPHHPPVVFAGECRYVVHTLPTPILFRVGPWRFRLFLVDDLIDADGCSLKGLCDADARAIFVWSGLGGGQRFQALVHELRHAWVFAVGAPRDAEADCDLTATMVTALWLDVRRLRRALRAAGFRAVARWDPVRPGTGDGEGVADAA